MFVICCFLYLFSYGDSLKSVNNVLYLSNNDIEDNNEFSVLRYTWKCQDNKCIRTVANTEEISLNTCNMLCWQPSIWPKPSSLQITNKNVTTIDKSKVSFDFSDGQDLVKTIMQTSADLFIKNLEFLKQGNQSTPRTELNINITLFDLNADRLRLKTDESYNLTVRKTDKIIVTISAQTYFGARHGLETLTQLIWYDEVTDELQILHDVDITDSPKFPYRGVMIDTARNFFPLSEIKKVVDGMAMAKLNVLHLHLTDSASFPIVLPKVKQLASGGAYGPDMIYTFQDIKDLQQYALIRGIRLLLEVDTPSHVNAGWNSLNNSLDEPYVICDKSDFLNGQLNPDNEDALQILENIYSDLLELSGDKELFHIGSDEVDLSCWQNTKAARNMARPMKTFWASYTNKMLERLKTANNDKYPDHIIVWSSPLTESPEVENLNVKVAVQVWLGNPRSILRQGHKVIYSTVGQWYLDCGFNIWKSSMTRGNCDPYTPWQTVYKHRPWAKHGYEELVLGGEVCLWSEQVEVDTLETRIWPRTAAFAERMWSDPFSMDDSDVSTRLVSFSNRLKSRGLKTSGIWPRWCSLNPGKC